VRSSQNLPSRDCLETPNGLHFAVPRACATGRKDTLLGASHFQETCGPIRLATFQTVSPRTSMNKGKKKGRS
jgi:hypothetical protein